MKKIISVILCAVLLACVCGVTGYGAVPDPEIEIEGEKTDNPIVILPGYSGCRLYYGDDPETGVCAWAGVSLDELGPNLLKRIAELGIGLGALTLGNADYIAKIIAEEFENTWPYMACNPDGTSVYDLHPYYTDPETTNSKWLSDTDNDFCRHDREMVGIFEDYVGKENIYNFNVDWRMGAEDCANQLNDYIKAVKKYTGKDKVNIYAISHGGQIAATYLALFGEQLDADTVVLSSPAIGGSGLASDLLLRQVDADEQTIVQMVEQVTHTEENYEWLLRANQLGFLDKVLNSLVPHVVNLMGYWPSVWDFTVTEKYEECKAKYLSGSECAPLAGQSDRFHYEILPTVGEKMQWCRDHGMNISIITGTGCRIASGMQVNSDAIIPVSSATGATCAPFGSRFDDGYTQVKDCGGKYKVSPDKTIDASTCYLPDNTWFSLGNYHAWTYFSDITKYLTAQLVLTNEIGSVYDDPAYPQFLKSDNESKSVVFDFNNAVTGYISGESDALEIRNVMKKGSIRVNAVYADGMDVTFNAGLFGAKIKPGESVLFKMKGIVPESSGKYVSVTVCYTADNITPLNYTTCGFTVLNGEAQGGTGEIIKTGGGTALDKHLTEPVMEFLGKLGLREWFSMLFTVMYCGFNLFR